MKNSLRRIAALLMAIMMLAALGMSVSAEGEGEATTDLSVVNFTKTLTKESNAYAPNTTYTFTIAPGTAVTGSAGTAAVYAGALDEVAFVATGTNQALATGNNDQLTITSTPTVAADGVAGDIGATLTYAGQIKIDTSKYEDPGVYRYTVTETAGNYAGITYDATPRTLDVYIAEEGNGFKVIGAVLYYNKTTGEGAEATTTQVKDGVFTNTYNTADLTVSKAVTGNLGDTNKEFSFSVEIVGVASEKFYILKGSESQTITAGADGKATATITLKDAESFTVYGLSAGDTYSVTETSYANDGYTTSYVQTVGTTAGASVTSNTIAATAINANVEDVTLAFTNDKDVTVPTGVALTILPFVAMIAIAAAVVVIFFKKKERREA